MAYRATAKAERRGKNPRRGAILASVDANLLVDWSKLIGSFLIRPEQDQ